MIYLYAYTNHKEGLDCLRRAAAIYFELQKQGVTAQLLLNDYRAQQTALSWGLPKATTIETIKDIDAVATIDDTIVIDSTETIEGRVLNYPNYFKGVVYINSKEEKVAFDGAKVINTLLDKEYIFTQLESKKSKEALFIYGDSDYKKTIIKNLEIFKNKNLDLYWGTYFFMQHEDELANVFEHIVEPEEYYDAIKEYKLIITSSIQIALEAAGNDSKVLFLAPKEQILEIGDTAKLFSHEAFSNSFELKQKGLKQPIVKSSNQKIVNLIKELV